MTNKSFFLHSLIFTTLVSLVINLVNNGYIKNVESKQLITHAQSQLDSIPKEEIKLFIFGDSHPVFGMNPHFFENAFNFAIQGEAVEQTVFKIKYAIKNYPKFDTAILPLDPHSLTVSRSNIFKQTRYWKRFAPVKLLAEYNDKNIFNVLIQNSYPAVGNSNKFFEIPQNYELDVMSKGFIPSNDSFASLTEPTRLETGLERARKHKINSKVRVDDMAVSGTLEMLTLLKENNIKTFIVRFPLPKEYLVITQKKDFDVIRDAEHEILVSTENKNQFVLDHMWDFADRPELFRDADHLNNEGATLLSKKVAEEIKTLANAKIKD